MPGAAGRGGLRAPRAVRRQLPAPGWSPPPGCYVTAAALALAPLVRAGVIEPTGMVVDAASGVSGAGRGCRSRTPLQHGRRGLHRLRPAQPPPHPRDRAGHRGAGDLHAPPGPHEPGHPGHLLRPARPRAAPTTRCDVLAEAYAGSPFVVVSRAVARRPRPPWVQRGPPHGPLRPPHRLGGRHLRHRQPDQGGGRPGHPVRQPGPRAARDRPACRWSGSVPVTAP